MSHRTTSTPDRGLLWDNDGVLVDTEKLFFEANRRTLAGLGIQATWDDFEEVSLRRGESMLTLAGVDGGQLVALHHSRDALYSNLLQTEPFVIGGIDDLLCRLESRFRMGIVTSSRRQHFDKIHARSGLLGHFSFAVVREDYARAKPESDGYVAGLEQIGLPADRCLAIEDSPRGAAAARAAGLEVVLFTPAHVGPHRDVGSVVARVSTVAELSVAIDAWAAAG